MENKRQQVVIFLVFFLYTINGCIENRSYFSGPLPENIIMEMKKADLIGSYYENKQYLNILDLLKTELETSGDDNIKKLYINCELTELYLHKIFDYTKTETQIKEWEYCLKKTLSSEIRDSSYINLPRYSKYYRINNYQNYVQKYRNIDILQIQNRLNQAKNEIQNLFANSKKSISSQKKTAKIQDIKEFITKLERKLSYSGYLSYDQKLNILIRISLLSFRTGDVKKGLDFYNKTQELCSGDVFTETLGKFISPSRQIEWSYFIGLSLKKQNDKTNALKCLSYAVKTYETFRTSVENEYERIEVFHNMDLLYEKLIELAFDLKQKKYLVELIEKTKSRTLLEKINQTQINFKHEEQNILISLDQTQKELEKNYLNAERTRSIRRKIDHQIKTNEIIASFHSSFEPTYNVIANIVKKDQDKAFIEYYIGSKFILIVLLYKQKIYTKRVSINRNKLEENVISFYQEFKIKNIRGIGLKKHHQTLVDSIQNSLFNLLVAPIINIIQEGTNLIFIPHGVLHSLPFNALHDGKCFLIEYYPISSVPSLVMYKFFKKDSFRKLEDDVIAFGNPIYPIKADNLPFAEQEVKNIKRIISSTSAYLREKSTETIFKQIATGKSIIHFATHGKFITNTPLNSFILLAADNQNDGFLSVNEIFTLDLSRCKLFVLSACETNINQVRSGDDLFGFTRSLSYAGVSSILSSLWSISDESTNFYMEKLYQHLKAKLNIVQSNQKAQIYTMKKYPSPKYWAAFQIIGNPDVNFFNY